MRKSKKRPMTMSDQLRELLAREDIQELEGGDTRQQILLAIVKKALNGDLKTIEFILKLIGEMPDGKEKEDEDTVFRIELGPGVEELAK